MKSKLIRVLTFLFMLLLVLPTILISFSVAVAAEGQNGIDGYYEDLNQTDVMTDLKKYGVDVTEYAIDQTVKPGSDQDYLTIVRLVEFGYDYKQTLTKYGLYVYIYNPTCMDLSTSEWNKIQIAIKKSSGEQSIIQKKELTLIDHTDDHLFYKFRVDGLSKELLRTMMPHKRIYLISGVEFEMPDWTDPHDYEIAGEYTFTGFLKGYGIREWDAETLYCSVEQFLTIKTELHMTNWRSDSSPYLHCYYDVAGVYFSIPNWILNKYGDDENPLKGLYEVEGEYYEYKINGLVTTNESTYDYVSHYQCQSFANGKYSEDVILSFWTGGSIQSGITMQRNPVPERTYNVVDVKLHDSIYERVNKLGVVFHYDDTGDDELSADVTKGIMSRKILDRIAVLQSKGEDPYLSYVDEGHIKGYNTYKITAGQEQELVKADASYIEEHPYLSFFFGTKGKLEDVTVPALQLVDFGAFQLESYITNEAKISDDFFLDERYVSDFVDYVQEKSTLLDDLTGSSVFMMHYSTTDTYIAPAYIHRAYNKISLLDAPGDHYYFEQSVFQDFDILSITMKDEYGNTTKIPVVADPKDFTPDLPSVGAVLRPGSSDSDEAPKLDFSWWENLNGLGKTLVIVAGLLVLALVFGLFGPIFKPIGALFGWIFSGIGAIFRGVTNAVGTLFSAREKRYDSKRKRTEDRQRDEDRADKRRRDDYAEKRRYVVDEQEDEKYVNAKRRAAKQEDRDDRRFESERRVLDNQDKDLDKKREKVEREERQQRQVEDWFEEAQSRPFNSRRDDK